MSVPTDARRSLVTAFVSSRLDYCNGVLEGVAAGTIHRLQLILHAAARLVVGAITYEHITPVIRYDLLWLPVPQRISYKIALSWHVTLSTDSDPPTSMVLVFRSPQILLIPPSDPHNAVT